MPFCRGARDPSDVSGRWELFDAVTGKQLYERKCDSPLLAATFSPDGTRFVTGHRDKSVRVWDAATFEELVRLRGHKSYVYRLAFSPDGSKLVSASGDKTVRVWDTVPIGVALQARRR